MAHAAVRLFGDQPSNQKLVAYVVPSRERAPAADDLRLFLRDTLSPYMIPAGFMFLDELPVTPTGKIDRKALPRFDVARDLTSTAAAPGTYVEQQLVSIWQSVLAVDRTGLGR